MRFRRRPGWILIVFIAFGFSALSLQPSRAGELRSGFKGESLVLKDPPELGNLKYRLLGPAWGGRVARVAGVPGDPNVYYAATAAGGVWKSSDGGRSWSPIFDGQPDSSVGSIAVAPSDSNVIYVGTGEANIRGNVGSGNGIYKSVDAGKTWSHVWTEKGQIGTMVVDPRDADVAFAAVLGDAFGPNPERGVYRTRDGGKTWQQVLKKDEKTGASDLALDPSNPNIVFAGLWQVRRQPWDLTSGGPGSGLYVSRDGGDTWKRLSGHGLPEGIWGKVGVAVAPSDGRRVYALIEAEEGGLFRSDDGGRNWTRINGGRELRQRAWYYSTITVNPRDPDDLWCPQVPMLHSLDGGKTFQFVPEMHHGDHHDIWIDPMNPRRMISCNDGGVDISVDGGKTWDAPPLPIGQFYHISVDSRFPFSVAGALQDIGTAQVSSDTLSSSGIRNTDWYGVGGGEAGWVVSKPDDPGVVYAGEYGGYISRYEHATGEVRNISIYPDNPSGHGAADMKYRFQWTAPIASSPHDPDVIYHGGNVLFRTSDGGQTWAAISPDLTRNDKSKQQWAGGPITGDNTGVETYDTIFCIAESPGRQGVIWVGSDDGLVHVTRDGGKNWTNVTAHMPGIPEWGTVDMIEPSHFDAGTAYVVVDAHRLADVHPYLYKTADYGQSWQRLDSGLPRDIYLHAVREDPSQKGLLYVGTERGVAFSRDDGASWQALKLNMPTVAVTDLQVKGNSLVLGTLGRSAWILDDLSAVRQLTPEKRGSDVVLLSSPEAVRWHIRSLPKARWNADNPPHGALIYYYLKEAPKDDITLEIVDGRGQVVNTLSSQPMRPSGSSEYLDRETKRLKKQALPKKAGLNRAVWNLRWSGAEMIPGAILDDGYPRIGPLALPGNYTIRLHAAGKTLTTPLKVVLDPREKISRGDLEAQLRFALQIRDAITRLTRAVRRLRAIRRQLVSRNQLLRGNSRAEPLIQGSSDLISKLNKLDSKLHNPRAKIVYDILAMKGGARLYSRLAPLLDWAMDGDGAPTQGMREVFSQEKEELEGYLSDLVRLTRTDLSNLNKTAQRLGFPTVYVP